MLLGDLSSLNAEVAVYRTNWELLDLFTLSEHKCQVSIGLACSLPITVFRYRSWKMNYTYTPLLTLSLTIKHPREKHNHKQSRLLERIHFLENTNWDMHIDNFREHYYWCLTKKSDTISGLCSRLKRFARPLIYENHVSVPRHER